MKKITLMFKERGFYNIFLLLILLIFVIAIVPRIFASLQPIKSVEIYSEKLNYKNSEPGSWKITKSAKWINQKEAEIIIDVESILKVEEKYTDMIFVLDTSGSMEGERLDMLKSTTTSLADKLLSDENNRVALITFDQGSSIVSEFTNEKDAFIDKVNSLTAQWVTNYYQALVNVDKLMKNYVKEDSRECVVVFLTDGYPNYDTPNEVGQYNYLKKTYPYLLINAIQYEMGNKVTEEVKRISDNQYVANVGNLEDILNEASVVPIVYESFDIEDFIDTNYFYVESKNDVKADFGSVIFDKDKQSINWSLNNFRTGKQAKLTVKIKSKDGVSEDIFPVNESVSVGSSLGDVREDVNSKLTPVLKEKYEVVYDVNAPSECRGLKNPDVEKHSVFETVGVSDEEPKCEGYQFKGWKYVTNSAKRINDDYFIMPEDDVNIKGTWSKLDISKTMDGTVKEQLTLYKQVQEDFDDPNKYVRKYTGDTSTFNGNEDVYYYYGEATNNNVIFANYCWKIVRTTDTGGVKLLYNGVPSNDLKCNNTKDNSQLTAEQMNTSSNSVAFSKRPTSIAGVGYMYNEDNLYVTKRKGSQSRNVIRTNTPPTTTNYYYADSYTYENVRYYLTDAEQFSFIDNYKDLVGKYTFLSSNASANSSQIYYIVKADESRLYYITLDGGNSINDVGYEPSMKFSDSISDNGDGTYTLSNPVIINRGDWFSDNAKYKNYYTCGSNELSCVGGQLEYVITTNTDNMWYVVYGDKIRYGNSFEWDGENYRLKDTIDIWNPYEENALNNYHYTCFNTTDVCKSLEYVYLTTSLEQLYIELNDGKSVEDALDEMLYSESANKDSSNIKMVIDYWYSNNMTDYTKYLEDTVWCNIRSMSNQSSNGWNPNGGDASKEVRFWASASLSCKNINDRFTISKANGNGALTYPVGLLTEDEHLLIWNPLVSGSTYFTMTPISYNSHLYGGATIIAIFWSGATATYPVHYGHGVRPSVSLRSEMEYSNGDGSVDSPYIIVTD